MSRLGFSTAPANSFLPIFKYDARAGHFVRVDRVFDGANWTSDETVIDDGAVVMLADLDNAESGWLFFSKDGPDMVMVRMADLASGATQLPPQPSPEHKLGVRLLVKLHSSIAGGAPLREVASSAKVFCRAFDLLDTDYVAERDKHPGDLPVVGLSGPALTIKTGSGQKTSTNFQPQFKIIGWAPRGDLIYVPKERRPQMIGQQPQQADLKVINQYPQRPSHKLVNTHALTGGPHSNVSQPVQYTMNQQGAVGQTPLPWDAGGPPSTGNKPATAPAPRQFNPNDFG